jgi:ribosome-associated toxin RatA of RatAB toxin-antitoxin module
MILESPAKKHSGPEYSGEEFLPTVQRSARVPYSAEQMFDLVNDVESYPKFLHWCSGARVDRRQEGVLEATLDVGLKGFHRAFSTRNTVTRPTSIELELVSGPFRRLSGGWRFEDLPQGGAEVFLSLSFEVASSPFGAIFSRLFEEIASSQMGAFISRAAKIYGRDV